ncbi:hypothetical protein TWF718_006045 [Orbilia javanica]|uniref:Uncharacterized protein n=1 Tax=Orbilia javanica TaxID=47235 RepID=A0AAN8RE14_9PEZI
MDPDIDSGTWRRGKSKDSDRAIYALSGAGKLFNNLEFELQLEQATTTSTSSPSAAALALRIAGLLVSPLTGIRFWSARTSRLELVCYSH